MPGDLILITGVSGYIGFTTTVDALQKGYNVKAVVRREDQARSIGGHKALSQYRDRLQFAVISDMQQSGAFESALAEVQGILHLASPLARETDDYDRDIIRPAVEIQSNLLESALKFPKIKRVVITSSAVTLTPIERFASLDDGTVYTSDHLNRNPSMPCTDSMSAYFASKALARMQAHQFLAERKPHFEIIQLLPGVVIGPDAHAMTVEDLLVSARAMVMPVVLGAPSESSMVSIPVLVNDVSRAHLDALEPRVPGNEDYILSSDTPDGIDWNEMKSVARKYFPTEVESGKLPCTGHLNTLRWKLDVTKTENAFGWKFTSFEETVRLMIAQYLELSQS